MIELKLRDIINSIEVLKTLAQKPLRGRVAYNVGKMLQQLENEVNIFSSTRENLVHQYATKDEHGNVKVNEETNEFIFEEENMKSFVDEMNKVLDTEVVINANKMTLSDIEDIDFTPAEILALQVYIEEE